MEAMRKLHDMGMIDDEQMKKLTNGGFKQAEAEADRQLVEDNRQMRHYTKKMSSGVSSGNKKQPSAAVRKQKRKAQKTARRKARA